MISYMIYVEVLYKGGDFFVNLYGLTCPVLGLNGYSRFFCLHKNVDLLNFSILWRGIAAQPLRTGLVLNLKRQRERLSWPIVLFKRSGSQHIHIEIKLQEGLSGIDYILFKRDLNLIWRLAYSIFHHL